MRPRLGLFVTVMICYKYADRALSYLSYKSTGIGHSLGVLRMDTLGCWIALLCLGILPFVCEIVFLRRLGYRLWWPLPFLAFATLYSFLLLWQRQTDSRIAFAVYFAPILILLFARKRSDNSCTEEGEDPRAL
jgi:hypothetical protein